MSDPTKKTVKAVEKALKEGDNHVALSTGVVLNVTLPSQMILLKVMTKYPRPKVPTYNDPVHGIIKNPDSEDYIEEIGQWEIERNTAMLEATLLLGTEIVEKPKGMPGPNDKVFIEDMKVLNFDGVETSERYRYLLWVMQYAADGEEDIKLLTNVAGRQSGVVEQDVDDAVEFSGSDEA